MKKSRGFTLVEVLVALTILALLVSVVLANMSQAKMKARDTQRVSDIQQLAVAIRMVADLESAYPVYASGIKIGDNGALDTTLSSYLGGTIKDPNNGQTGFGYYYSSSYTCNGTSRKVLIALTMERSNVGNFASVCDTTYNAVMTGVVPTSSSYVMILQ